MIFIGLVGFGIKLMFSLGAVRTAVDDDLFGSLYDNVFLRGHVADQEVPLEKGCKQQFVPGYLALFL